jgi:hypothetical protein
VPIHTMLIPYAAVAAWHLLARRRQYNVTS